MPTSNKTGRKKIGAPVSLDTAFPVVFHVTDREGVIIDVSDRWIEAMQMPRTSVVGRNAEDFIGDVVGAGVWDALRHLADGDQTARVTCKLLSKTGQRLRVALTANAMPHTDGDILWVAMPESDEDLVERIRTKSYRLQSCIEGTNAGTWEWNVQTGETRFNDRWAEIVGYSLEDLGQVSIQTWLDLAHPDDLERSEAALKAHWAGETPFYDIDARMRHKDGHWVWVHDRGRVFTWTEDGAPEWMFGTHFSIDDAKKRHFESERLRRLFQRMGEMAGVGGWEVDLRTNEVLWTAETRRIHGVDDNFVPTVSEGISFYAPEARPIITEAVERAMQDGTPWDLELPFIRLNGDRIWVRAVGEVEFDGDTPTRMFGAFQDISDRTCKANELRATQEWMRLATSSGGVGLWSLDAVDGTVTWDDTMAAHFMVSEAARPDTLAAWLKLVPEQAARKIKLEIKKLISSQGRIDVEVDFIGQDGVSHALKLTGQATLDADGLIDRIQGACFDLTPERRLMLELKEQTSKMSVTLSSIGDGVITTDRDRRITWINEVASTISGWSLEEAVGRPSDEVFAVFDEDTGAPVLDPIRACLKEGRAVALQPNSVLRQKSGTDIAVDDSAAPIVDDTGRALGAVLVFRDVSNQRRLSRDIEYRATHDLLTGLLNRTEFENLLRLCLKDPIEKNASYLFFFDLDHFKRVNDTLGHDAGDRLLHKVGRTLRDMTGPNAHIARQGGDEFIVLTRVVGDDEAKDLAERICRAVSEITIGSSDTADTLRIGVSGGIVNLGTPASEIDQYMRRADIAAYAAKEAGRGQVCIWADEDAPMQTAATQLALVERVERASADGTWVVHEQHIAHVDPGYQSTAMRELLIRLPGENGKLIGPDQFLPAAERYGLMPLVDLWMFRFCLDLIGRSEPDVIYALNLSPASVSSRSFQRDLLDLLQDVPRDALAWVCIEITETSMVQSFDTVSSFLHLLKAKGVKVAIDDFGSGASSFRYFSDLPADYLKIDGSFIRKFEDPVAAASLECFIRMAKVCGLQTIAEHVEDTEMVPTLCDLGIDLVQGFAIHRPEAVA